MNKILLFLLLSQVTFAQIKNPGFEAQSNGISEIADGWRFNKVNGFSVTIDSNIKSSGHQSLKIENQQAGSRDRLSVSGQYITIETQKAKRVLISAWIKTEQVAVKAAITCTLKDENDKDIGGIHFPTVGTSGTNDWKKYTTPVIIDKEANKIMPGAYLRGGGMAWFDDFTIEEISSKDLPPATTEVTRFLNNLLDTIYTHSIYRDSIQWAALRNNVKELSRGMTTIEETNVVTDYILSKLMLAGDNHTHLESPDAVRNLQSNAIPTLPGGKYLSNNIGYVKVPHFNTLNDTSAINFAEALRTIIKTIDDKNTIRGWIVDLRECTGGSLYPMIAGLEPILGMDTLGYFISADDKTAWYNSERGAGDGNEIAVQLKSHYFIKNPDAKIAVLIGHRTGSSGEGVAISFIGKSNTKLFGEPSAGFTTGNNGYPLRNGSMLFLARSIAADRNMKKYYPRIYPDVNVAEITDADACIKTATDWILQSK